MSKAERKQISNNLINNIWEGRLTFSAASEAAAADGSIQYHSFLITLRRTWGLRPSDFSVVA